MHKVYTVVSASISILTVALLIYQINLPDEENHDQKSNYETSLSQATIKWTDQNGKPSSQLSAKSIHYQNNTKILFADHPLYTHSKENTPSWRVSANQGTLIDNKTKIILKDQVKIKQIDKDNETTTLHTDYLTIIPKTNLAITDHKVLILQGKNQIHASGLTLNLNDNHIELHGNTRGIYDPND